MKRKLDQQKRINIEELREPEKQRRRNRKHKGHSKDKITNNVIQNYTIDEERGQRT